MNNYKEYLEDKEKLDLIDYFCGDENYYYNSWLNGNKNHVITHLRLFSMQSDTILYNNILQQFSHDSDLLKNLLEKVSLQAGTFINKAYL